MTMRKIVVAMVLPACVIACGPSWKDVVVYDDGTYKDTRTGECFKETSEGIVPVQCPRVKQTP
jgi:major membrane immunogen (membrane-anchored lipoprotein)